ncbi:MAG: 50S ribosomal protein L28 [Dehalococcoidia bacterium]|nr:50S ribosomal protein L28 [Dehalococcoidia bacterium]
MKCEICGKGPIFGNKVSHSKRHTRRRWLPNVHRTNLVIDGMEFSVKICTRCLRTQYKTQGK